MMDGGFTNKGKTTVVPVIIINSLLAAANAKLCRFQRLDAILTVKTLAYPGHIRDKRATYNGNDSKNILQNESSLTGTYLVHRGIFQVLQGRRRLGAWRGSRAQYWWL